ncbi:hypothetical protein JCM18549_20940 [Halolamina salina]
MRMGNLLRPEADPTDMATKQHSVGIDHVTVVPEPAATADDDGDDED